MRIRKSSAKRFAFVCGASAKNLRSEYIDNLVDFGSVLDIAGDSLAGDF